MQRRPLLTFYGDDFTGSTDALEALARAGLRTALFLQPPQADWLRARFPDLDCIGVAGTSRAMTPAEMDAGLAPVLRALWALGAPLLHYKVCSTFDSSPHIGSIGHVIDLARREMAGGRPLSVLVGAPALRRYTVFGNHFAAAGEAVYRLDRHPTMAHHPSTPMDEADLREHLARQTKARVALMSLPELDGSDAAVDARLAARLADHPDAVLYDVLDEPRLTQAGRLIWAAAQAAPHVVVGSSGVGYALAAHWRATGLAPAEPQALPVPARVDRVLVLSGSASPATARQIEWAAAQGFETHRVPAAALADPQTAPSVRDALAQRALAAIGAGRSVVLYTAAGPGDPSIGETRRQLGGAQGSARLLGSALGQVGRAILERSGLRRLVIAGGDTSSYAAQELGIDALEVAATLTPGAPLCRAHAQDAPHGDLEIAFKGGQMGGPDYFGLALGGG